MAVTLTNYALGARSVSFDVATDESTTGRWYFSTDGAVLAMAFAFECTALAGATNVNLGIESCSNLTGTNVAGLWEPHGSIDATITGAGWSRYRINSTTISEQPYGPRFMLAAAFSGGTNTNFTGTLHVAWA